MYWADELAGRRSAGPRSSTTPRRRRAPSTWAACAASCCTTPSRRALARARPPSRVPLRRRRPRPHGLPGAADARRGRALHGRAAGARAGARGQQRRPTTPATSWASCSWARSRASASRPTLYWMSELYGDGAMDPYIRSALDQRRVDPRDLPPRQHVEKPAGWLPDQRHLRELRQDRHDPGHRLGRRDGGLRLPAGPRSTWATRLRPQRARVARSAAAPSCPSTSTGPRKWSLFGITIEGCGKDLATAGGSRDRSDAISRARSSSASRRSTCPTSS